MFLSLLGAWPEKGITVELRSTDSGLHASLVYALRGRKAAVHLLVEGKTRVASPSIVGSSAELQGRLPNFGRSRFPGPPQRKVMWHSSCLTHHKKEKYIIHIAE